MIALGKRYNKYQKEDDEAAQVLYDLYKHHYQFAELLEYTDQIH